MKLVTFNNLFIKVCFLGYDGCEVTIDLDNGSALNRQQAII